MDALSQLQRELRGPARQLIRMARDAGIFVHVNSVYRSRSEQAKLYAKFLAGLNPYPVAPPGHSMHELRRAFDLSTTPDVNAELGAIWNSWGGHWSPRDRVHFEA